MLKNIDFNEVKSTFDSMLKIKYAKTRKEATEEEIYSALASAIMAIVTDEWQKKKRESGRSRKAFYLSAEFLVGRALGNNILNLGIGKEVNELLGEMGLELSDIEDYEEDAALGNGGLGRLAACFMESGASLDLDLDGYGVKYKEGLFKQSFVDGFQREKGDRWDVHGYPWAIRVESEEQVVHFKNQSVVAVPYDMPIIGYEKETINTLRLWQAEPIDGFDFNAFNNYKYDEAVKELNRAEDITRVLYPNDGQRAGKVLRLKQQYFFVSASIKDLIRKHKENFPNDRRFKDFSKYCVIQLNDTHPVIAIPELIRIFIDYEGLGWDEAIKICNEVFNFTNHTILSEGMEVWDMDIVDEVSPRIVDIIKEIDKNLIASLRDKSYSEEKINSMSITRNNQVHMAALAIYISDKVNGVAALHTEILKEDTLSDWHDLYPGKIINKTNGVTPRRWLAYSNPGLAELITELLDTDEWIRDLSLIKGIEKYKNDASVLEKLGQIKRQNKVALANYIYTHEGIKIDPDSIFDTQIKRLHEYKRQLLNAFHIVDLYNRLKENPDLDITPRTFIFGAKAAPGYFMAKAIIKFINEIARVVNSDERIREKIKIVFVENYRVSYAERIIPATNVSEQISTAGKEASGTGNMKFMMNGALTLGTYDGANIEIFAEAGVENNYLFGAKVEELREIENTYNPIEYYATNPDLKAVVDSLVSGEFNDNGSYMFLSIYNSLVNRDQGARLDPYYVLKDFHSYKEAQNKISEDFKDQKTWNQKALINIANSSKFSSDRTIKEYAKEIWDIE